MKVEIFHSPGCAACVAAREQLRTAAKEALTDVEWREVNVLDNLDQAVALGVLTLPAIAIDGELVFTSLPTPAQLRDALVARRVGAA
jgi:protein-disulfide isomerase